MYHFSVVIAVYCKQKHVHDACTKLMTLRVVCVLWDYRRQYGPFDNWRTVGLAHHSLNGKSLGKGSGCP